MHSKDKDFLGVSDESSSLYTQKNATLRDAMTCDAMISIRARNSKTKVTEILGNELKQGPKYWIDRNSLGMRLRRENENIQCGVPTSLSKAGSGRSCSSPRSCVKHYLVQRLSGKSV
jgi:hypothetical protein